MLIKVKLYDNESANDNAFLTSGEITEEFVRDWYSDYRYEVSPLTSNKQVEAFVEKSELIYLVQELLHTDPYLPWDDIEILNEDELRTFVRGILEEMRTDNKAEFFEGFFDKHTPVEYMSDDDDYIYYRAKKDDYRP